jgi:hypothetical protein
MHKQDELEFIAALHKKARTSMAKPRSYAAFYLDEQRELVIYEAADIHKLKDVIDIKHPGYELIQVEAFPDSATPRNLANAARQIKEIRQNALALAVVNKPTDHRSPITDH